MRTKKFGTERMIKNFISTEEMEKHINSMIGEFFRELMFLNMCAEGETLRFEIDEKKEDPADAATRGRKPSDSMMNNQGRKNVRIRMTCMMREAKARSYDPEAIYKNGRNTTVKWEDGTVTTVKLAEGEESCDYTAFTAALARKIYGTNSRVKRIMEKKTIEQKKKEKKK